MPIVSIEIVADANHALEHDLAQTLADGIGRALDSPPGKTWVRLRSIMGNQYAENENPIKHGELPVFVTVLKRQSPQGSKLEAEVAELTMVIAQVLGRPAACVHVEYAPAAVGRVSFGGKLVQ